MSVRLPPRPAPSNEPPLDHRVIALSILTFSVLVATTYSLLYDTSLDTSDPTVAHLPHPHHDSSYFARKSNVFNQLFVKKAWGWTTGAFLLVWSTSPAEIRTFHRFGKWIAATATWAAFTLWFFGPALFQRLVTASGGECVVLIPSQQNAQPQLLTVPIQYCVSRTPVTTASHPDLFTSLIALPDATYRGLPKLYRGHDVSGHLFLLTLSILFLADQISYSILNKHRLRISKVHALALNATVGLIGLWWWMELMTSVYFHNPAEKFSGYALGVLAWLVTQIPLPQRTATANAQRNHTHKRRVQ